MLYVSISSRCFGVFSQLSYTLYPFSLETPYTCCVRRNLTSVSNGEKTCWDIGAQQECEIDIFRTSQTTLMNRAVNREKQRALRRAR